MNATDWDTSTDVSVTGSKDEFVKYIDKHEQRGSSVYFSYL